MTAKKLQFGDPDLIAIARKGAAAVVEEERKKACLDCNGSGKIEERCLECHDGQCSHCEGSGTCAECEGEEKLLVDCNHPDVLPRMGDDLC